MLQLRSALSIKPEQKVTFERFSDSAGGYITLDPSNPQVFKTLNRAAKAKLKLRLKATVTPDPAVEAATNEALDEIINETTTNSKKEQTLEEIAAKNKMEPIIVQTPVHQKNAQRGSKASDGKSVGSGIFQFREARASEQTLVDDEAPVPRPFSTTKSGKITGGVSDKVEVTNTYSEFFTGSGSGGPVFGSKGPFGLGNETSLPVRTKAAESQCHRPGHAWSVYCNNCDKMVNNAHYHCSICDDGDYDLCEECVTGGKLCPGEGHWLIKRVFKEGNIISSTTERLPPKFRAPTPEERDMHSIPGAFKDEKFVPAQPTRTCNCCVIVLPENAFVTCEDCADYDLCIPCHANNLHGHHPAHGFKPATDTTVLSIKATDMLSPGRNARHNAICDACDKSIIGVRHKCLDCPDWDLCNGCINRAPSVHPRHRFAAIYTPLPDMRVATPTHAGIYCDGPLCVDKDQTYIRGIRYKCAVCHDTDFCASCEALPTNHHNRTHPLIKFKTPVHGVTINTMNQEPSGRVRTLGDKRAQSDKVEIKSTSTDTTPTEKDNAATQVQTVADFKPTEAKPQPIPVRPFDKKAQEQRSGIPTTVLDAHFVHDTVKDGSVLNPANVFTQIWTLVNPGPAVWPAGCSVRYVGGDNMLNVDNTHPASVSDIANAAESNVCGREVGVGEMIAFKVVLKAPVRQGKAISYWHLKAADGTSFGHKLWVDIEVKQAEGATPETASEQVQSAPSRLSPYGQAYASSHARLETIRSQQAASLAMQQEARLQQIQARQFQQQQAQQQAQQQSLAAHSGTHSPFNQPNQSAQFSGVPSAGAPACPQRPLYSVPPVPQALRDQWYANMYGMKARQDGSSEDGRSGFPSPFRPMSLSNSPTGSNSVDMHKMRLDAASLERKEAAKLRVEAIKSKIMKAREAKAKAMEEARDSGAAKSKVEAAERKSAEDAAKVKKIIEEASKEQKLEDSKSGIETSQMIFPRLDKESPASSTYQSASSSSADVAGKGKVATVESEGGKMENSAATAAVAGAAVATPVAAAVAASVPQTPASEMGFEDLTDDLEVLSADGEDSEDDGFLTDEEYDILDASDQETIASP